MYFKCDICDKYKLVKEINKISVVVGRWVEDLKKTVRTPVEKWICNKCKQSLEGKKG